MRNRKLTRDEIEIKLLASDEGDDILNEEKNTPKPENPSCWSKMKGDEYVPAFVTNPEVPSGLYEIKWNSALQTHALIKQPMNVDELYELPSDEIKNILEL